MHGMVKLNNLEDMAEPPLHSSMEASLENQRLQGGNDMEWRLATTGVFQALVTLGRRAVTQALIRQLLCKRQLPDLLVFVMYVEMGQSPSGHHVKSVFKFYLSVYKFNPGQALVFRKSKASFVFCLIDTPGFRVPNRSINYVHM